MTASNKVVTIAMATVLPSVAVLVVAVYICFHQRRKSALFKRGVTPIDDDEIESWRVDRGDEKELATERKASAHHQRYTSKDSTGSMRKPPSVVIYHNQARFSAEASPRSPRSIHHYGASIDSPPAAVLARAPNARPGLTDEAVQGDDAYVSPVKRQQSRGTKNSSSPRHDRSRSVRSSISIREHWYSAASEHQLTPRHSAESLPRMPSAQPTGYKKGHHRVYSSPDNPPQRQSFEDEMVPGGLSPRPLIHKSEIGRAIG